MLKSKQGLYHPVAAAVILQPSAEMDDGHFADLETQYPILVRGGNGDISLDGGLRNDSGLGDGVGLDSVQIHHILVHLGSPWLIL